MTWLTKGLRRDVVVCGLCIVLYRGRNWPDLRRDCDFASVMFIVIPLYRRNWPDLRRDCDPRQSPGIQKRPKLEEIDLTYEGIATYLPAQLDNPYTAKKLTWLTKGLRPLRRTSRNILRIPEEIDLTYEGIATNVLGSFIITSSWRNWPDLRRDCDSSTLFVNVSSRSSKKLTWLTKGLRH